MTAPAGVKVTTPEVGPGVNPAHLEAVTKLEHVRRTFERAGKDDLDRNEKFGVWGGESERTRREVRRQRRMVAQAKGAA